MKKEITNTFVLLAGIAALTCMISSCGHPDDVSVKRPNILLISVDDLNNWIEPMGGHPQAKTPNLMKFADEAVTFTNAYCASPSCNPSRTALFTGRHPWTTGLYNNIQIWRQVLPDELTLFQYFRQAGYWAGGAGKLFHNQTPDPRSWDAYFPDKIKHMPEHFLPFYDSATQTKSFKKMDNELREDDPKGVTFTMPPFDGMYVAFDFKELPYKTEETGDYSSVKWVCDQLNKKHDKPFFLACGLYRPHLPWYVPEEFFKKFPLDQVQLPRIYDKDLDDIGGTGRQVAHKGNYHTHVTKAGVWKHAVQGYLAAINFADHLVGELLATLENSPYANSTIVVIFSDHGWQLGEKEHWRKFALWENVLNSVLMVKVPKGIKGLPSGTQNGKACSRNVSLVDMFPTLTELCGLAPKAEVGGRSLIPLLSDPAGAWDHPVVSSLKENHFSVRKGNWHYINYGGKDEELYNLKEDSEEWHNLAGNPAYDSLKQALKLLIPRERHKIVPTDRMRWEDVLNGTLKF